MKVLGVTGCVGAGKSTVCLMLAGRGWSVLDVDALAAEALEDQRGALSKREVMTRMFSDEAFRKELEARLRPAIERRITEWKNAVTTPGALDAALLFESGLDAFCDQTLALTCPTDIRRKRVGERNTFSRDAFDAIEAAQLSDAQKCARATFVVSTDCDFETLEGRLAQRYPANE